MLSIKFLDREEELKFLRNLKNNFFVVVLGRRRIGKTRLLLEAFKNPAYIFIWPNKSLSWIIEKTCEELKIPSFRSFGDILEYLFDRGEIVILDEFQNFLHVDKSVFGEIQKIIDGRKFKGKEYKLIVCGSSYSMLNKIFYDVASPLYGRKTHEIRLDYLPLEALYKIGIDIGEFVKFWSVFGGVPYYYEFIDKKLSAEENIKTLLFSKQAVLREEGKAIISMEFGAESKTYNTILSAIAEGKTKLHEIATLFENKVNLVIKYLDILRKEFNLVRRVTPVMSDPKRSKEGIYEIRDNFLKFWFSFIERNRDLIEQEREEELVQLFENHFNSFVGRAFERFIAELIKSKMLFSKSNFTKIGRQWGKIPKAEKGKNTYEIDIIALDEKHKKALCAECKWKERVNAEKVVKELAEKVGYVKGLEGYKIEYGVFAKGFSKRVKEFNGKKVYCFGLRELEEKLKRR